MRIGCRVDRAAHLKMPERLAGVRVEGCCSTRGIAKAVYSPLNIPQTGGGLRLSSPDLLKIAALYLDGGRWKGEQIINEEWVKASTTLTRRSMITRNMGTLWWLPSFKAGDTSNPAFFMTGNAGDDRAAAIKIRTRGRSLTALDFTDSEWGFGWMTLVFYRKHLRVGTAGRSGAFDKTEELCPKAYH